jgi:hypothetical protein
MVLPWLGTGDGYRCETRGANKGCRAMLDEGTRRSRHCSDFPPDRWIDPPAFGSEYGGEPYPKDAPCPGACMRRPLVREVAAAYAAFEKGQLDSFWPDAPACIWDGVMALHRAINVHAEEQIERNKAKASHG